MPETDFHLSISKEQIATLPIATYKGAIVLVDTPQKAHEALKALLKCDIIGFDTETKPSYRKNTSPNKMALMQLCTRECCYLLRINKIGFPLDLVRLLEAPHITKIGLSIHDDFHVMHRSCSCNPQGFVELQTMVKDYKIADLSLQKIFAILFSQKISKGQRLTNWEADTLTQSQQVYGATDAWACLEIYDRLTSGKFIPEDSPYKTLPEADSTAHK